MKNVAFIPIVLAASLLTGCFVTTISYGDVSNYENYLKEAKDNSDFHTELYIFPSKVNVESVSKFSYKTREDLFTGSYLFFLKTTYDKETFDLEVLRLGSITAHFKGFDDIKPIVKFDSDEEDKHGFLTINRNNRYEYALYDEKKLEITYVSNQLFEWPETKVEGEDFLPEVTIPSDLDDGDNSYNMYYLYKGDIGYYVED